jgi:hypothetical protein
LCPRSNSSFAIDYKRLAVEGLIPAALVAACFTLRASFAPPRNFSEK